MAPEFQGTKTLQPFAPRWTDPDLLEKTLVGRRELVDKLEQLVLDGAGGPNKYQRLIIGPRGSGKTHVLKVLHTRLWRNAGLKDRLLIVYLLEDELGVASFLDFLVRLLKAIVGWYSKNAEIAKGLDELYDLPASAQQRRAVELLLEAAGTRDVLIIMENLGVTFDSTHGFGRKGQQALRDLVQQHPRFMIFASAQALLDGISEPNAPFFEFFTITHLKKLSLEEATELLKAVAAAYGNSGVSKFLGTPEGRGRVRAIYDFTGGNHRLLVTFYDFLSAESVAQISDAFIDALKPLKPYYQEQMRALSAQQQKIVQYLSMERTPRTVKEVARGCLATSNTVSSQMRALLEKGFVERIEQGRESYYEISETLFRICYEADLDRQGAPIRLFVDFLGNFYTAQELEERARGFHLLGHESESALYGTALLRHHNRTFDGARPDEWKSFFHDLAEHQAYDEIISFARRLGDSKDSAIALVEADAYVHCGDIAKACAVLQKEIEKKPDDPELRANLGLLLYNAGDWVSAATCCRRALELNVANRPARAALVGALAQTGRYADALAEFQVLMNDSSGLDVAHELIVLGVLHDGLGHAMESEDVWRRAVAADPASATARLGLARRLTLAGRFDAALAQYEAVTALDPTNAEALAGIGMMLAALGHVTETESQFRAALAVDAESGTALWGLGILFNHTGQRREALTYLKRAARAGRNEAELWREMGVAHQALGEWDSAEESFRKALELKPALDAVAGFADALRRQGRLAEGEPVFRDAIQRWPQNVQVRRDLGLALMNTGRFGEALEQMRVAQQLEPQNAGNFLLGGLAAFQADDMAEAEKDLRKATELDGRSALAWLYLGHVMTRTGRNTDAAESLQTAASLSRDDADIWTQLAIAWRDIGNLDQAETALRRAVELNVAAAVVPLAALLIQTGRIGEAETLLREWIERDPSNARARDVLAGVLIKTGRLAEAREQLVTVRNLEPENANNFLRGGLTAFMAGDPADAERQLRTAIELDRTLTDAWIVLGQALFANGRHAEAIDLLGSAPEEAGRTQILASRGDLQAAAGNLSAAAADYQAALKLDPANTEALFHLASVLLRQGRVGEAAEFATRAIQTQTGGENLVDGLRPSLDALFSHCTRSQMGTYLEPVLEALSQQGQLTAFEQALSLAVFALLKKHEGVSEDRFADTVWALENLVAGRVNVSVPVLFLNAGVDYFKRGDRKALMKLSREERALFTKELGITDASLP